MRGGAIITSNDLFDLYYALVLIRNDIKYELNPQILKAISKTILSHNNGENAIRKEIASVPLIDYSKWGFVLHHNLYVFCEIVKDQETLYIIAQMCNFLQRLIEAGKFDQAYDFADSIHYIPILAQQRKKITRHLIKSITRRYAKKWGHCF